MDPVTKVEYHVIVVNMVLNTIALNPVKRNVRVRNSVNKKSIKDINLHRVLRSAYDKRCNKDPLFKSSMTFEEYYQQEKQKKELEYSKISSKWKGAKSPRTFHEKIDSDLAYASQLRSRTNELGETSMGQAWGIGNSRPPKKNLENRNPDGSPRK